MSSRHFNLNTKTKKSNQSEEITKASFVLGITRSKLRFATSLNFVCKFYLKYILNLVSTHYFCRLMIPTVLKFGILFLLCLGFWLILSFNMLEDCGLKTANCGLECFRDLVPIAIGSGNAQILMLSTFLVFAHFI